MSWGTDENWRIVAMHFFIEEDNPRLSVVQHISKNESVQSRLFAKELLESNGIWEQALQIAKENDLSIC